MILHVTNGSAVGDTLGATGIGGQVLTWDDVLHDGPVPGSATPAELRARRAEFLSARGWISRAEAEERLLMRDGVLAGAATFEETILWFEPDLYDQLQLLQILDRVADAAEPARVTLIQHGDYLGPLESAELASLFPTRRLVTEADLACAAEAWAAFGHDDPRWLARLAERKDLPLPWVAPTLRRLLAQYPGADDGLSLTERLTLHAITEGANSPARAFLYLQKRDIPYWMGDTVFAWYLERMATPPAPLVARRDGAPLTPPPEPDPAFWHAELQVTDLGKDCLAGVADWILAQGIDRWYGGVHLEGHFVRWRWDEARGLVEAA